MWFRGPQALDDTLRNPPQNLAQSGSTGAPNPIAPTTRRAASLAIAWIEGARTAEPSEPAGRTCVSRRGGPPLAEPDIHSLSRKLAGLLHLISARLKCP